MNRLLSILGQNSGFTGKELSAMLGSTEECVETQIRDYESRGIIRGYRAVIDWEAIPDAGVEAVIELKVTPKAETGFDETANLVSQFSEVESVYLMAGSYDLMLIVKGETIQDIASFVAKKLSALDGVISTSTHFLLKRYKEAGVLLCEKITQEEREGV